MWPPLRRAALIAAIATLAVAAPVLDRAVALPYAVITVVAVATAHREGRPDRWRSLFETLTTGRAGFALAATILAVCTTSTFGPSYPILAASLAIPAYGVLGHRWVERSGAGPAWWTLAYVVVGAGAGVAAYSLVALQGGGNPGGVTLPVFVAAGGALAAGAVCVDREARCSPAIVLGIGALLWFLATVAVAPPRAELAVVLAVVLVLAALSYRLGAADRSGMLAGAFIALLALVLGDYRWFVPLVLFYAVGGVSTKYRYERKRMTGVAEARDGTRGVENVVGNAGVALLAIAGFAAAPHLAAHRVVAFDTGILELAFRLVFLGSLACALGDTLASEIGGVFDGTRLITTLEPVAPGTDGAITWQGQVAGIAGSGLIAVVSWWLFDFLGPLGTAAILVGGVGGMTADSLLGATLESRVLGNQHVNFLATLVGGVLAALIVLLP